MRSKSVEDKTREKQGQLDLLMGRIISESQKETNARRTRFCLMIMGYNNPSPMWKSDTQAEKSPNSLTT